MDESPPASPQQDSTVARQYNAWARVYDLFWRRYVNQTVPVALRAAAIKPGERVIDLGCGTGELERRLMASVPDVEVVGVDIASSMVEWARGKFDGTAGVRFERADVHDLPFEDDAFDVAICVNTFHYFTAPDVVLREADRVLRPDGRLIVLDWCRDYWTCRVMDRVLRLVDPAYQHCYTLDEMATFLENAPLYFRYHFRYRFDLIWGMMVVEAGTEASA